MVDMTAKIIPLPISYPKKRVSVVVVSYYTGAALFECLQAVLADPDIFELILVDNGNPETTRERLWSFAKKRVRIKIVQGQGNVGFGRACNYGAKVAKGDYILFLNPDAIIEKGAALKMAECGENLNRPWVLGGFLQTEDGVEQRGSRRRALTPWSAFVSFTPLHKLPGFKSIHIKREKFPSTPHKIPTVSGACMMMDRESFNQLGGFDERFFLHVEDIDLCRRARLAGGQVYSVPPAKAMHYGSTSQVRIQRVEFEKFKGFVRYFWNYSAKWWARILLVLAVPFMFVAIMGRAWWLALSAVWRG
jgi:GT2 family glycosyltransferase